MATLQECLALARTNDRVCPQPQKWNQLYELLPGRVRSESGWNPPLPLVLGAWWETSDKEKAARLEAHLMWAHERGALEDSHAFLHSLSERDWHHAGE